MNKKIFELLNAIESSNCVESDDIEFKAAQGKNNEGELPKDFWRSYAAMANTGGGVITLGVKENSDQTFEVIGIKNTTKVIKDFWNTVNNKEKISENLLTSDDVNELTIDDKKVITFSIPRASRKQRPIYIGQNPMLGT